MTVMRLVSSSSTTSCCSIEAVLFTSSASTSQIRSTMSDMSVVFLPITAICFGIFISFFHNALICLIFTGEILNEQLWVDALHAHCDGIILKSGELLTRDDVLSVMNGKKYVFNQPILKKIVDKFCDTIQQQMDHQEALIRYEIDEYDERFLRHLALGYTKDQISQLRTMPFGVKSLEKRQNELVQRLFPNGNGGMGVNATRLVVKAFELNILDVNNLYSDEA